MNPYYKPSNQRSYKNTPRKRAKALAWSSFSRIIRLRDAILTTGTMEYVKCCTCGKVIKAFGAKNMGESGADAGHWPKLDGRHDNVLFVLNGIHAQCVGCNQYGHGKPDEYDRFMDRTYPPEMIEEIRSWNEKTVDLSESDLREIHKFCRALEKAMIKKFNNQEFKFDKEVPWIFKEQNILELLGDKK